MSDPGRAGRLHRISRLLLIAGVLLAVVGVPATSVFSPRPSIGYAHLVAHTPPSGSNRVNLTMNATDAPAFSPSLLAAGPGDSVSLTVHNLGTFNHTFTVSRLANYTIPSNITPSALHSFFLANGSLVDAALPAGKTTVVNFTVPVDAGGDSFEFASTLPFQFQAGMHGFLNVSLGSAGALEVVQVNTTNQLSFVPDTLAVNATGPVALAVLVTNLGSFSHTFTVVPQKNVNVTSGSFPTYFATHPPLANVQVPASAQGSVWANFTVPGTGIYQFICEISGHLQAGMMGYLYVGVAPPPPSVPPSTAIVQPLVLAGAGGLLGLGLLVAGVASLTGRFPERPPSESPHH